MREARPGNPNTIANLLAECRGHIPGFDAMRFLAASAVLLSHSFGAAENRQLSEPLRYLTSVLELGTLAVFIFFFVSGFVVTQSCATSTSVGSYLLKRTARIIPGLILVTSVCALLIGPAMTTLPLKQYFTDQGLYKFYLNCVFVLKGELPGVFQGNPSGDHVNVSLWTLRHEVLCYIIILFVVATGRVSFFFVSILAFGLAVVACTPAVAAVTQQLEHVASLIPLRVNITYLFNESIHVIPFFFVGALCYYARNRIVINAAGALVCLIVLVGLVYYGAIFPLFPFALGYVIMYIGFCDNRFFALFRKNDYSYGIYIFAFPIQQTLVALAPGGMTWWQNTLLAYPIVLCLAILSWHFVERPCLRVARNWDKMQRATPKYALATSKGRA